MIDGGSNAGACRWCEEVRDLVDLGSTASLLFASPDGDILTVCDGDVCPECRVDVVEQWELTGNLTRPLASIGAEVA